MGFIRDMFLSDIARKEGRIRQEAIKQTAATDVVAQQAHYQSQMMYEQTLLLASIRDELQNINDALARPLSIVEVH